MKVAIIEDERRIAEALKEGFALEEHEADIFLSGATAKEKLEFSGGLYDLIVLDLMLPDADGKDVCSDLRATGVTSPILVLTARDSTEDKIELLDRGADDFMTKPFDFGELIARSRALSRRPAPETQGKLSFGDLSIIPERHEVQRKNESIPLTAREFELLMYLARNHGRIISRTELLAKVWKQNDPGPTNVVDVHVRNLRKKLDDPYATKHIQTVHGVGYTIAG